MKVYCSSGVFPDAPDVPAVLKKAASLGISRIELSSGLKSGVDDLKSYLAGVKDQYDLLLHNYFPVPDRPFVLNLAAPNPENRKQVIEFCKNTMELCAACGSPFYSVHAGYIQDLKPEDLGRPDRQQTTATPGAYEQAMELFVDSVNQLLESSDAMGVDLLIENNVHAVRRESHQMEEPSHLLLANPESIKDFFSMINHPGCGLLWDSAHWRVSATHLGFDAFQEAQALGGWIRALHLSDNNYQIDSNEMCQKESWFWPLINEWNLDIPVVLESYRLEDKNILSQLKLLEDHLS